LYAACIFSRVVVPAIAGTVDKHIAAAVNQTIDR
jgi:hypothetical protein